MNLHSSIPKGLASWLNIVEKFEAPYIYTYWAAISATTAVMGRKVAISYMAQDLFANMYTLLVGEPACKKSTVINQASEFMRRAGYKRFAPDNTSKRELVRELMTGKHKNRQIEATGMAKRVATIAPWKTVPDELTRATVLASLNAHLENQIKANSMMAEATISVPTDFEDAAFKLSEDDLSIEQETGDMAVWTDEFQQLFGRAPIEALQLLQKLWDCPYEHQTPEGIIYQPFISIFSAINPNAFNKVFEARDLSQGLLPRMILVSAQPSGRTLSPFNIVKRLDLEDDVVAMLVRAGQMSGSMYLSKEASILYARIVQRVTPEIVAADARFVHYSQRRNVQLIKMAMALQAMHGTYEIDRETLLLANTILCYTETGMSEALGEYGLNKDTTASQAIMSVLSSSSTGIKLPELIRRVRNSCPDNAEAVSAIARLSNVGKIITRGEGPQATIYKVEQNHAKWAPLFGDVIEPTMLPEWEALLGAGG